MAKRSVLSRPLPNQSLPRNTFDRSFFKNLNWSAGMLLPVFCQFVPVGSSGKINRSIFMRTNAVNTAAFPEMSTHIDFYKVPLKLLMTRYEEFKLNVQDANNTASAFGGLNQVSPPPSSMPWFDIRTIYANYFTAGNTSVDAVGDSVQDGAIRLLDLLGYNPDFILQQQLDPNFNMSLQTFKLQAYQKVYYDHYRNSSYESNNPFAYNADYTYNQGSGTGEFRINELDRLLDIHYVNYRKDFFMNIYPALNYVVSSPSGTNWLVPSNIGQLVHTFNSTASAPSGPQSFGNGIVVTGISTSVSTTSFESRGLTVQSIRAAFALDKLMRLSSYAPKHVKDQLAARFGVKSHATAGYESQYLGSFKNDIVIGEVTSTADTSASGGAELGTIGGRGVGAESRGTDIHFEVTGDDDDSIIIGVMYTLARSVYDSFRLDAFNFKFTREDIFNPEFMDLGLRPIYLKEVYSPGGSYTIAQLNTILGYVPRDQEYKLGIDENHGLFRSNYPLAAFTNHTNVNVSQRGHTPGTPGVDLSFFKISPHDLDSIFAQNYDPDTPATDQFFGKVSFVFISRQNMSVHGQPRL